MKYLFILEDGTLYQSDVVTPDELCACNEGMLIVINMVEATEYYNDEWTDIKPFSTLGRMDNLL